MNKKFSTPHWALIGGAAVGMVSLFTGTTDKVITLSVLGAVVMYIISMMSLLKLRGIGFISSFRSPFYPWFPVTALILSCVCLAAIVWYNTMLSAFFFAVMALLLTGFVISGKHKQVAQEVPFPDV